MRALLSALALSVLCGCVASPASASKPFAGTNWELASLGGKPVAAAGHSPSLRFSADDKRVAGYSGCNRFDAGYTQDGGALRIAEGRATRMACVQGMETEDAFFAMLRSVAGWRIEGERLKLVDSAGTVLAEFTP